MYYFEPADLADGEIEARKYIARERWDLNDYNELWLMKVDDAHALVNIEKLSMLEFLELSDQHDIIHIIFAAECTKVVEVFRQRVCYRYEYFTYIRNSEYVHILAKSKDTNVLNVSMCSREDVPDDIFELFCEYASFWADVEFDLRTAKFNDNIDIDDSQHVYQIEIAKEHSIKSTAKVCYVLYHAYPNLCSMMTESDYHDRFFLNYNRPNKLNDMKIAILEIYRLGKLYARIFI